MTKPTIAKLIVAVVTCLAIQSTAMATGGHYRGNQNNQCDVVSLNGTGRLLEGGRIVGTETFSIMGTDKQIEVVFSMTTLGTIEADQATGVTTLVTSHDFSGAENRSVNFTTFDEIKVVPLGGNDPTCTQNACGLIFKLKLETGHGRYSCGEIVSGLNPEPNASIPFTSFVNPLNPAPNGDTVILNSVGKLCKCSGNN